MAVLVWWGTATGWTPLALATAHRVAGDYLSAARLAESAAMRHPAWHARYDPAIAADYRDAGWREAAWADERVAMTAYVRSLAYAPDQPELQQRVGEHQLARGLADQAERRLAQTVRYAHSGPWADERSTARAYLELGRLAEDRGDAAAAAARYVAGLHLDPWQIGSLCHLAELYERLGYDSQARDVYRTVISMDLNEAVATKARRQLGRVDERLARTDGRRVIE